MGKFVRDSWLTVVLAVASGLAVAGVYKIENPKIQANKRDRLAAAVLAVVPGGHQMQEVQPGDLGGLKGIYRVFDADQRLAGWAAQARGGGFQGDIVMVFGLSPDAGRITGIEILESLETPGLGDKINDPEVFKNQFRDKTTAEPLAVVKRPPHGNEIKALTAATISSRAVVEIVNKRLAEIKDRLAKEGASR